MIKGAEYYGFTQAARALQARRGIPVRIILAPNPYHDAAAIPSEKALVAGSRIQWHWAPARFDAAYATGHAKYLIVNPGTPQAVGHCGLPEWNVERV